MGERLVNWLYHEANEDQRPAVMHAEEEVKRCHDEGFEAVRMNDELLAGLLAAKLKVRRLTDETATLAGNVMADHRRRLTLRNLDPTSPVDAETLRKFWRRAILLRYKTCELRRALLALDLEELGHEVRRLRDWRRSTTPRTRRWFGCSRRRKRRRRLAKKKNTGRCPRRRATLVAPRRIAARRFSTSFAFASASTANARRSWPKRAAWCRAPSIISARRTTRSGAIRSARRLRLFPAKPSAATSNFASSPSARRTSTPRWRAWRETGGDIPDETAALVEQCARIPRRWSRCRWRSARGGDARGRRADGGFALRAIGGGGGPALDGDDGPLPPVARHPHHLPPRSPGEGGDGGGGRRRRFASRSDFSPRRVARRRRSARGRKRPRPNAPRCDNAPNISENAS